MQLYFFLFIIITIIICTIHCQCHIVSFLLWFKWIHAITLNGLTY